MNVRRKQPGPDEVVVSAFYHFTDLDDCALLQQSLFTLGKRVDLSGMVLLAHEGINATVVGSRQAIDRLYDWLDAEPCFNGMTARESLCTVVPFKRFTVKIKTEIVRGRMDLPGNFLEGSHVEPEEWDQLLDDPDVLVLDMRNDYEVRMGTFDGAVNPQLTWFSDIAEWTDKHLDPQTAPRVAMFCTGGIRCEKAAVWFRQQGVKEVYQLSGGILNYLDRTANHTGRWQGDCFVFDHRIAVDHHLRPTYTPMCCYCQQTMETFQDICPHCHRHIKHKNDNQLAFVPENKRPTDSSSG